MSTRCLCELKPGESATVVKIEKTTGLYQRFADLGIIKNTIIECVGTSPLSDPSAYLIRGAVIAIRDCDSKSIIVKQ